MKQVHNVRIRVSDNDIKHAGALCNRFLSEAGLTHEHADVQTIDDGYGDTVQLWADRQQPVRKLLALLLAKISDEEKRDVASNPSKYLDTGTHCFLHLDKPAFEAGEYKFTTEHNAIHIRLNIAAFPATKENAIKIVTEVFNNKK